MSTNMNQVSERYADTVSSTSPARQAQIPEAFDVLEKSVVAHEELCAEMEKRLNGVLRNEPEAAEGGTTNDPKRTVVGVASRINGTSDRLHSIANRLNSILRRLEL